MGVKDLDKQLCIYPLPACVPPQRSSFPNNLPSPLTRHPATLEDTRPLVRRHLPQQTFQQAWADRCRCGYRAPRWSIFVTPRHFHRAPIRTVPSSFGARQRAADRHFIITIRKPSPPKEDGPKEKGLRNRASAKYPRPTLVGRAVSEEGTCAPPMTVNARTLVHVHVIVIATNYIVCVLGQK